MRQNATDEFELSPSQWAAIEHLLTGATVTEAAEAVGVDRTTVHRWRKEPAFQAAYNRGISELRDAAQARIYRLAEKAARTVEVALDADNVTAAIAVLKGTGYLSGEPVHVGPSDPSRIAKLREQAAQQEELLDMLAGF